VCSGRVLGVFVLLNLLKKSWAYSGLVFFAFILKKNWGVFRACFGRGSKASSESKGITGMAPLINGVCSGCYSSIIYQQIWGVFWACSGCVVFASFKKKILGVFWACSGCIFFASILKKKLGRVPGVFSVFQCVQCVVSSDPVSNMIMNDLSLPRVFIAPQK
jgi:hypothetical protein